MIGTFNTLLIISLQIRQIYVQKLYDTITNICTTNDWYIYNGSPTCTSSCLYSNIFGGVGIFTSTTVIAKTIVLSPHYKISIEAKFWGIDWLSGYNFFVLCDQLQIFYIDFSTFPSQSCSSTNFYPVTQTQTFLHSSNSITLYLFGSFQWGIQTLKIWAYECPIGCSRCDDNGNCLFDMFQQYFITNPISSFDGWEINGGSNLKIQTYTNTDLLFNYNFNDQIQKKIERKYYSNINISFKIISENAIGLSLFSTTAVGIYYFYTCGETYLNIPYTTSNLKVKTQKAIISIQAELYASRCTYLSAYYGIRDFQIFYKLDDDKYCYDDDIYPFDGCFFQIYSCVEGCKECIEGYCLECNDGWDYEFFSGNCKPICGDKVIQSIEECDDGNLAPQDGCFNCKFSCPLNCKNCKFGQCNLCQNSYYLQNNNCVKYFNDISLDYYQQTLTGNYDQIQNSIEGNFMYDYVLNTPNQKNSLNEYSSCDVNSFQIFGYFTNHCAIQYIPYCNLSQIDKCLECQEGFENSFQQNECLPKCNDLVVEINEQCDDNNNIQFDGCYHCQNNCQIQCLECSNYGCIKCQEGWELSDFQCQQVCSDSKIAIISKEQCDDGNYVENDGCYNCQYECSKNCSYCDQVECLVCEQYYEINQQNQCQPKCGDGYIIPNVEDCEDGNNIQFDGCFNCKYQCRKNCQDCGQGICLDQCDYGYYLIDDECQSKCGDMIVTNREECDDGNNIQYDGCFDCKYQCRKNCQNCDQGICLDECDYGYYLIGDGCQSQCGDMIVTIMEECDDGNNILFDGCFLCMSSCVDSCVNCAFGRCLECAKGYIQKGNYCFDDCGNGFKDKLEMCDDGNQVSGDGCSPNCETEDDWECLTVQEYQSYCIKKPQIQLSYLNQTYDIQYVQLSFTKRVILDQTSQLLEESIQFQLNNYDQKIVFIKFEPLVQLNSEEYQEASYLFTLQFKQTIVEPPKLIISFNSIIYDQDDLQIDSKQNYQILLKSITLLSQNQKELAQHFQQIGNGMIIGLGISSLIILLTGNFLDCFEILNTLQYQSVLRYINVEYPQNLLIYFQSSDLISITPALEKIHIIQTFDYTLGYNYLESIGQFKIYGFNSDLMNNIYGQLTLIIGFLIAIIFIQFYKNIYYKHCFTRQHLEKINISKSKLSYNLAQLFFNVNQTLFKIEKIFTLKGFQQLFLGNSWDIIFKVFLFLAANNILGYRELISYTISSVIMIYSFSYLSNHFVKQKFKFSVSQLFKFHQPILLVKQILFLFVLIGLQYDNILQSTLLTIVSTFYLCFIITFQILSDSLNKIIYLMMEGPILIFTMSSLAYCKEFKEYINDQNKIYLGFGQVGLLILGLASQLGKYLYIFYNNVKQKLDVQRKKNENKAIQADHIIFGIS